MKFKQRKLLTLQIISLFCFLFLSPISSAHGNYSSNLKSSSFRIFSSYESNGADYIEGIGIGTTFADKETKLGFQLNTSFNNAEVTTTNGYVEDFFSWQGNVKFGLFSTISIYAEAGIDLTELLFQDLRDHDDHDDYHEHYHDDIDAFIGLGLGFQVGPIRVEAFTRLREIDSRYWEAESEVFTGFQFSLNF